MPLAMILSASLIACLPLPTIKTSPSATNGVPAGTVTPVTATAIAPVSDPAPSSAPDGSGAAYGYVFTSPPGRITVRPERDATAELVLSGVTAAVSPDAKRLAYWRNPQAGGAELRVLDVADPRNGRAVMVTAQETLGGSLVWSNDGQGLLVSTYSRAMVGPLGGPERSDLVMVELTTTSPDVRPAAKPVRDGFVYLPVAWDRPGQAAAGVVTGEGRIVSAYVTWSGMAAVPFDRSKPPSGLLADRVQASPDARFVMGFESRHRAMFVWPLLNIAAAGQVPGTSQIASAAWRPDAVAPYEIIRAIGTGVDVFQYPAGTSRNLYSGSDAIVGVAVRPDGSGIFVMQESRRARLVDFASGSAVDVPGTADGLPPLPNGVWLR